MQDFYTCIIIFINQWIIIMKLLKLVNTPTTFFISSNAQKNCRVRYGDDLASLMLESIKNAVPQQQYTKPKTFMEKLLRKISPKKQMSVGVFSNNNGDFYVQSNLKVGNLAFSSEAHTFDFFTTLNSLKNFKEVLKQTHDDILKQIETYNKNKRLFRF